MSLFENTQYEYTDTFFVFFRQENLPAADIIERAIADLGNRYEPKGLSLKEERFESMTVLAPLDFSAIDIVLDLNTEIASQIEEISGEFRTLTLTGDDQTRLDELTQCDARFDLFHFERLVSGNSDPDAFIDPGGLLIVLEKLRELCSGVGVDPQSQMLL